MREEDDKLAKLLLPAIRRLSIGATDSRAGRNKRDKGQIKVDRDSELKQEGVRGSGKGERSGYQATKGAVAEGENREGSTGMAEQIP